MSSLRRSVALVLPWVLLAGRAQADGTGEGDIIERCASASERAQAQRDEGALLQARSSLITCAASACPTVVRDDCTTWLQEVERAVPTVVLSVRDARGRDQLAQRIRVDGEPRGDVSLGRAFAVDPGPRTFSVVTEDGVEIRTSVVVREGEKGRAVVLPVASVDDGEAPSGFSVPVGAWILGGVGLASVGVFGGLAGYASAEVDDMRATCAPGCPEERVDEARRFLIAGNVMLGVGLAAVGAALTWTIVDATTTETQVSVGPGGLRVTF